MDKMCFTPEKENLEMFRKSLISWGKVNFRNFPWRVTKNPYRVLIAEILLHRTQAIQVVPVYKRFIESYPDITSLAKAKKEELYKYLKTLGLFWRIESLHKMANILVNDFKGQIPFERSSLLSLPGVSDYIASAVRCFAWNFPEPVIDTNTVRVTGRLFGLPVRDSSRRNRKFFTLISVLLEQEQPRDFNFALLDLADKICVAKGNPKCQQCPVEVWCSFSKTTCR